MRRFLNLIREGLITVYVCRKHVEKYSMKNEPIPVQDEILKDIRMLEFLISKKTRSSLKSLKDLN